ncbi:MULTISPECIES: porin [Paraburkholderia]|uniref:porin n=1 Tax=Paraburkholderia TaxID=1822464 RepID=UPI00224FBA26|nr:MULTISPECIES: porin [Paraburkholderia]MCX4164722.1 porin [Paraburkholderia megapolitana]MDN7160215.1 porin [Paraburkholderia sp. CHISQ3]MDQ6497262.1 porin [Paraburkholderia megapolitana]
MKNRKIKAGIIAVGAFAASSAVMAQSSVTLYGMLDAGIGYTSNVGGHNKFSLDGGASGSNKWGIKGQEDLGGGLKAVFRLENGFNIATGGIGGQGPIGTSRSEFNRQAFVGLASDQYGTVRLGRQLDAVTEMVQGLTGDAISASAFSTPGDVDNNDNTTNQNNAVKYISPLISGFQAEGAYSFGGVAGAMGSGQSWSVAADYVQGGLTVAGGYFRAANQGENGWVNATAQPSFGGALGYPSSGYNGGNAFKSAGIAQIAGQYEVGPYTAGLRYSNAQYQGNNGQPSIHFNVLGALLQYRVSPALSLAAGYTYVYGSAATPDQAAQGHTMASINQASLGASYALSKTTSIYAMGAYVHALGAHASAADFGNTASGGNQVQANVGMYHSF